MNVFVRDKHPVEACQVSSILDTVKTSTKLETQRSCKPTEATIITIMKFCNHAILSLASISIMGGTVAFQQCDAFAVVTTKIHSQNQKDAALVRRSTTTLSLLRSEQQQQQLQLQPYQRFSLVGQKLFAANDDDEEDEDYDSDDDDDDEENGPLSNGIDSVSWLPSVVGKTGENIKGAKEVS